MIRIAGPRVTLRRFAEGEFDGLWAQELRSREERFGPGGPAVDPTARERFRSRIAGSGNWTRTELLLAVEAEGELTGTVQARRSDDILPPGVFEIGIEVFRDKRGEGIGTEAVWLIADHLFREEGAIRVQLGTDVDNVPMKRSAESAGFRYEGVMRSYWPTPGESPHDYALYAMTASDHEKAKPPWTRTS